MLLLAWPGSIPKLVGGMMAMAHTKKLSIVALALLALCSGLFFTWRGLRGTEPTPRAAETARAIAPAAVTEEPAPPAEPVAAGWSIGVKTLHRDKSVMPGVAVEARVIADGATVDEQRLTTDALGGAAWRLPAFEETIRLELRATAPGVPDARREVLVAIGNAPPETIELRLGGLDGAITGRVFDPHGEPIQGATVESSTSRATTGADGKYALPVPADRKEQLVWAHAPGYAFERVAVVLRDARGTADLRLREEFRIRGVVKDEEGHPVHGAIVRTFFTGYFQHAVSDREGRYLLAHLDPGRDQQMLEAGHPAYAPFQKMVVTAGSEATEDIVLRRGLEFAGRVEGPDGKPVAGARLSFGKHDPVDFGNLETKTGEDGRFAFGTRLQPGEQPLIVDHPAFAPFSGKVTLPADGPVTIRLEAGHHISGTVVDDLGRPIEIWLSGRTENDYLPRRSESDAKGHWRLDGIPAGKIGLEFYGEHFQRTTVDDVDADREDVVVTVPRAAIFQGRVVDDASGKPIPSFTLRVTSTSTPGISATWVREGYRIDDNDGRWTIDEEFAPGVTAGVEARADGYAPGYGTATAAIEPDPDGCVVRMRRGFTIEGLVLDDDTSRPVEGALVRMDPPGAGAYALDETYRRHVQRTGTDGRFRFPSMEPGLTLQVEHPGHAPFLQREVGEEPLTIRLHGGCVVEGTAGPGDEVALIGDDKSRDAVADAKGRFRFEELPEGKYQLAKRLRIEKPPYTRFAYPVVLTVEVTRKRPVDVELIPLGTATVRGTIGGTKDVDGTVVFLSREGDRMLLCVFVHGRGFEFTGVEAGRYRVILPGADPKGPGTEIDLKDGDTREVTLRAGD